jgi:hypothetical protein
VAWEEEEAVRWEAEEVTVEDRWEEEAVVADRWEEEVVDQARWDQVVVVVVDQARWVWDEEVTVQPAVVVAAWDFTRFKISTHNATQAPIRTKESNPSRVAHPYINIVSSIYPLTL